MSEDDLQKTLDELQKANQQIHVELARDGVGINPATLLSLRLETLLEAIVSAEDRIRFEIYFESKHKELLERSQEQVRMAKLTQGVNPQGNNGLFIAK